MFLCACSAFCNRFWVCINFSDWNISWKELKEVVALGVLTLEEAKDAVSNEFNPIRAVFHGAEEEVLPDPAAHISDLAPAIQAQLLREIWKSGAAGTERGISRPSGQRTF